MNGAYARRDGSAIVNYSRGRLQIIITGFIYESLDFMRVSFFCSFVVVEFVDDG